MMLNTNITLAFLNYKRLDSDALQKLQFAKIANNDSVKQKFIDDLGMDIRSAAFIEKCNAIMILLVHDERYSQDFITGRILTSWDKYSAGGIVNFAKEIQFKNNSDVIQFLAEAAAGLHSVTIGDSQVLSQITNGLNNGLFDTNILHIIANWIRDVIKEVSVKTKIFDGNTSVERIISELIVEKLSGKNAKGLIMGYGQSGKLIAKILNVENNIPLYISNRKVVEISETDLNVNTATYKRFDEIKTLDDLDFCIVALENNVDTKKIVASAMKSIQNKDSIIFADIATPPLLGEGVDFIDIKTVSKIANSNINNRLKEVNKTRKIIVHNVNDIIKKINYYIGKKYVAKQKNIKLELDEEKINLAIKRNEILTVIREFLSGQNFVEVTTPYIVGLLTDPAKVDNGDAIEVKLRDGVPSFLRQSNQIYKQILVVSGMRKIYEIGPFWRKEGNDSYRHLFETIGLDIEMQSPKKLSDLYETACSLIKHVYESTTSSKHLNIPETKDIPVITYREAVDLLVQNGESMIYGDDLGLTGEMSLSKIVRKKQGSDIFVIKNYPDTIKKFYTKDHKGGLTETFDVILDGWELASGAIRQTDGDKIRKSMLVSGINPQDYEFYISLIDGSIDHGGFGLGIDRLIAKILDIDMVHDAVLFPRTHKKLIP